MLLLNQKLLKLERIFNLGSVVFKENVDYNIEKLIIYCYCKRKFVVIE